MIADDLPPIDLKRWGIRRKAAVVRAVQLGLIDQVEACRRYRISNDEFSIWQRLLDRHGTLGLRVTRIQKYRELNEPGHEGSSGQAHPLLGRPAGGVS